MRPAPIYQEWYIRALVGCLIVTCLTVFSILAKAEQLPNDADLQAAYCLGFWQSQNNVITSLYNALTPPQDPPFNLQLDRLQSYLIPRIQYLDILGIEAARYRGVQDYELVMGDTSNCINSCQQDMDCREECINNSKALSRTTKCGDLNFLPY